MYVCMYVQLHDQAIFESIFNIICTNIYDSQFHLFSFTFHHITSLPLSSSPHPFLPFQLPSSTSFTTTASFLLLLLLLFLPLPPPPFSSISASHLLAFSVPIFHSSSSLLPPPPLPPPPLPPLCFLKGMLGVFTIY